MAPFRLPNVALNGIFQMMNVEESNSNHGGGTLEDDDNAEDEMHLDEFMKAVVSVAISLDLSDGRRAGAVLSSRARSGAQRATSGSSLWSTQCRTSAPRRRGGGPGSWAGDNRGLVGTR